MNFNLKNIPTPQLIEIKSILEKGVVATSEKKPAVAAGSQLCHKSPPAGYPSDKSQYADPECYRYPINSKARCLAAWRYIHQGNNKTLLGDKFGKIESKIKSTAKDKYNLDLQEGAAEEVNWEQVFFDYYDAETSPENGFSEEKMAELKELEAKLAETEGKLQAAEKDKTALTAQVTDLTAKASQIEALTKELEALKAEIAPLRAFKQKADEEAAKAEKIKTIKSKITEAGLDATMIDSNLNYWLAKSDEDLTGTITLLVEAKKVTTASAEKKEPMKIPAVNGSNLADAKLTVAEGFKERKQTGKK